MSVTCYRYPTYNPNDPKCAFCDQSAQNDVHQRCEKLMDLHRNLVKWQKNPSQESSDKERQQNQYSHNRMLTYNTLHIDSMIDRSFSSDED